MTWDDFERVLCFVIYKTSWDFSWADPWHQEFDQRETLQLANEYLERWPA